MRRLIKLFACAVFASSSAALIGTTATVRAQEGTTFTDAKVEYVIALPSPTWRVTARPDSEHQHAEFVYGDRSDGYLRVRKEVVDANAKPADLSRRDHDQKFRFQPGYAEGKLENFPGTMNGVTSSYEYTAGGKPMVGRVYYLQSDNRTIYVLHFTGARDKLLRIRNQTDAMARSFRLK